MNSLLRFTPNTELRRMQREFDRLFTDFFPATRELAVSREKTAWAPRVDLSETENAYEIVADLPGIPKKDITINFHEGVLTISGTRAKETKDENKNFLRVERTTGDFYRSFSIPNAVQSDKIEAAYNDGVLEVRIPKAEEVKPQKVKIS